MIMDFSNIQTLTLRLLEFSMCICCDHIVEIGVNILIQFFE